MKIRLYCSWGKETLKTQEQELTFIVDDGTENQVVNLYPHMTYQTFEGFGGAITDAAGYVFSKMNEAQQEEMLDMYYSEAHMNYTIARIHMDSCDFSTHLYSAVEDENDKNLDTFDFSDTQRYIIPLLDEAEKKAGRKLKLMLSPWSPPAFMKTNGERKNGGSLKKEYRRRWAEYLCKYIEAFKNCGYEVARISAQNEPKAVQTWDSCIYTAQEEKEFVRDYLYPTMQERGHSDVEIFVWDHNKERLFERAEAILDDETDKMVAGMAFHWYSGDHFEALDLVKQRFPEKKLILSESCLELYKYKDCTEEVNAVRLAHDMIGNLNHGMEAFYDWNILLDEKGGPNHAGNFCDAPYLYDEKKKELIRRRLCRYYWHFTHFIRPGAVRISATRYTAGLEVTAWKNPDGQLVLIMLNTSTEELPCVLRIRGELVKTTVKAGAIVSAVVQ